MTLQLHYLAMLGRAVDRFRHIFRGDMRRVAEAYGPRLSDHLADVATAMPRTLIHGYYRTTNLFSPSQASGELAVIDWQTMAVHCGLYDDVAFFLINSVTAEVRREIERSALKEYHRIITTRGVRDIFLGECWQAYRRNCLEC